MNIVCLDLEGVLIPEIWIAVAEKTGIEALTRTTRDEPDYDKLMRYRLNILKEHNITLPLIQDVIGTLAPLPGAKPFIDWLKGHTRLVILSDTFAEFARPLIAQLDFPTLFCHELVVDAAGHIHDYKLRLSDHKRKAVEAFQALNFKVIAAGDSYNDLSMLQAADQGILFKPAERMVKAYPDFPVCYAHDALKAELLQH